MAFARIRRELNNLQKNPPSHCCVGPVSEKDMYHWEGAIMGSDDTPYEGRFFYLTIHFPVDYPLKPPKVLSFIDAFLTEANPEIAELYKGDRSQYEANARSWTAKYAMG